MSTLTSKLPGPISLNLKRTVEKASFNRGSVTLNKRHSATVISESSLTHISLSVVHDKAPLLIQLFHESVCRYVLCYLSSSTMADTKWLLAFLLRDGWPLVYDYGQPPTIQVYSV